jgi:hypothetical protein
MQIRIVRNDAGNCINFYGTSNPTYWNACLEGVINSDNPNNIDVVNKIRSVEEETTVYEFFNLPYTVFLDRDENSFESPAEAAAYITEQANVLGDTGAYIFSQTDLLDAQREETDTTVLFSNGDIYAVNSLRAVAADNGTITIQTVRGDRQIYTNLRFYNVTVEGGTISFNTIEAAVNRLNEVLSGQPVSSDSGASSSDPAVNTALGSFTVYGDRLVESGSGATAGYTSTAEAGNFDTSNGILSNESISSPGDYFQFSQDQGDWSDTRGLTFGLFDETTYDQADLEEDVAGNAVKSVLRLRLINSPFIFIDPASTYGRLNENGFDNSPATRETFRLGLDVDNRAYISMQLEDGTFQLVGRTESALPEGTELKLMAIFPLANVMNGIRNFTVNTVTPTTPALTWFYIESPDGVFHYPLFSSSEQANYVDEAYGTAASGSGASSFTLFPDETPVPREWHKPSSYGTTTGTEAPAALPGVVWNEINQGDDAEGAPAAFSNAITVNEGAQVNIQIVPTGETGVTYSVTNLPSGLAYDSGTGYILGNAPAVDQDNVANPSDEYSITVTKANIYGSSVGTLTLTVNNLTAPSATINGFTHIVGTTAMVDTDELGNGTAVELDDTLPDEYRLIISREYVNANILPALDTQGEEFFVGVLNSGADLSTVEAADFDFVIRWSNLSAGSHRVEFIRDGVVGHTYDVNSLTNAYYDYGIEIAGTSAWLIGCNVDALNTEPSPGEGGMFSQTYEATNIDGTAPYTIVFAGNATGATISVSDLTELAVPEPPVTDLTTWSKAVDFSGGSEHLAMASGSAVFNPMMMGGTSVTTAAPATPGNTSNDSDAHPWAAACVFAIDGNNSSQHIWNLGEGAGSTDDNIYLRTDQARNLYFGWGRSGALNEYYIARVSSGAYYGVYVGFNGTRLSGNNATTTNLAAAFDIRLMFSNGFEWIFDPNPTYGGAGTWQSTGGRMDRQFTGQLSVGGRGANRSFHGKVASMVVTTLRKNQPMPADAEIKEMITDPLGWVADYKEGNDFRHGYYNTESAWDTSNQSNRSMSTQVWLMGDGTNDSYANGIRNQVSPNDTQYTSMAMVSMLANDIETVSISGLS